MAMSLVADHFGEIVTAPFEFDLTETGVAKLIGAVVLAERERSAIVIRIGVEAAGHYHRTVVARLLRAGLEVVELNPGAVKQARSQQMLRALKTDARDLGARWPSCSSAGRDGHRRSATRLFRPRWSGRHIAAAR
jgi:transposase